ncbi:hypothetical protein ElyMa_006976500 [Elysia marginata]|uniref:Uncharacterized protein n=1 Tax=Elysia marginata TaxID=1093978 RepID=A0AAV4JR46_9GAST|nr:hypothetical protein ElyMa_006976500 [Elysia marginata]
MVSESSYRYKITKQLNGNVKVLRKNSNVTSRLQGQSSQPSRLLVVLRYTVFLPALLLASAKYITTERKRRPPIALMSDGPICDVQFLSVTYVTFQASRKQYRETPEDRVLKLYTGSPRNKRHLSGKVP